jgi:hypothetical protein
MKSKVLAMSSALFVAATLAVTANGVFAQATLPIQEPVVPTAQSTAALMARHDALVKKYASAFGTVAIGQMTKAELDDYIAGEKILERRQVFGDLSMPANVPVEDLPSPGNLSSDDSAGTAWDSKPLAQSGPWRFLAFQTLSILPVPKGWEVYEAGYNTHLFFPAIQMSAAGPGRPTKMVDVIHANLVVRRGTGVDDAYGGEKKPLAQLWSQGDIEVGIEHVLAGRSGYFLVYATKQQLITLILVSPLADHDGYAYVAIITMHTSKWRDAEPLLAAMFRHWCDFHGNLLLPNFSFALSGDERRMLGIGDNSASQPTTNAVSP